VLNRKLSSGFLQKLSLVIWLLTLVIFGIFVFIFNNYLSHPPIDDKLSIAFFADIIIGVIAFISLFSTTIDNYFERKKNKQEVKEKTKLKTSFSLQSPVVILLVIVIAFLLGALFFKGNNFTASDKAINPQPTSMPTPIPTPIPTKAQVVVDSDPIIDCDSSYPNCKGTSIRVRRSQCSKITCCQVGNTWSIYPTNEKCDEAQKTNQPAVTQAPKASSSLNYYCYDNTYKYWYYTSSGEQCNINNLVSLCKGIVKSTYDFCMKDCLNAANRSSSACINTYVSGSDSYNQCQAEVDKEHQSCMDACSKPYLESSSKCNQ
jgi:hypothetical protein